MDCCGKRLSLSALPAETQPFTPQSYFSEACRFGRTRILFQLWLRAANLICAATHTLDLLSVSTDRVPIAQSPHFQPPWARELQILAVWE